MAFTKAAIIALLCGSAAAFTGPASFLPRAAGRNAMSPLALHMDAALIVQNKGGGHGEIGFHLAKQLRGKGLDVTLLQDATTKFDTPPFRQYGELDNAGVEVVAVDFSSPDAIANAVQNKAYTHVFDNFAKNVDTVSTVATLAKSWGVKNFAYVSSGGMYESKNAQPMTEDGPTKATGQRGVEEYLASQGLPWTSFRPQYIYGPATNKRDYLDWFFDRIVRDRPCPLPGDGQQLASVSRAEDVASMLASVVGREQIAAGKVYNCGTNKFYSYQQICEMVAQTTGKQLAIKTYNPKDFELPKGAFPFRNDAFFVSPYKAQMELGWAPTCDLAQDMAWYYQSYQDAGKMTKAMAFEADDIILSRP
eukprot:CAMPEP_0181298194 /NCGR_PEP_ID=MMETSP1101-20121128/5651_1 /TAXON_ID=46948 /ORGANISM="Rhodomonas abbreviata, Strain Caron Lab Isolate" /LENGTH=362 /DNA_ID=CAMNT_0023403197 /DNA_START=14 /DNA_END=1102 /DNA_ORIENTATION=-